MTERPFTPSDWQVEVAPGYRPAGELAGWVRRAVEPGPAADTLHWGRNYLYVVELDATTGPLEVVVKQFRNRGLVARWKRRRSGSKAEKSWRAARAVAAAGLTTAEPVMWIESRAPEGPSFFVSRRVGDGFEARLFFRALNRGGLSEEFPGLDKDRLLAEFGRIARTLHDAGVWHRDFSIGNLLVCPSDDGRAPRVFLIDLNRARLGLELGVWRRTRDICRLPVLSPEDETSFLGAYWGARPTWLQRRLFRLSVRAFLLRNRIKDALRRPRKAIAARLRPRHAHEHIPPPPENAGERDRIVWDQLSDQPHQHAGRMTRIKVRLKDLGVHAETLVAAAGAAPRVWGAYRQLEKQLDARVSISRAASNGAPAAPWGAVGVALRPHSEPEKLLAALDELAVRHVLLRLHPWQNDHRSEEELARELGRRGYDLAFVLPQNRDLVKDRQRWRAALAELAERFMPFGSSFQVGQAINRTKWGIWNYREYLELARDACDVLRRHGTVEILGPAVIDFEHHLAAAVLNMRAEGVHFDVVSSLLYVDRRGAPENKQLGFDTARKAALLKAVALTAKNAGERCWVTEVNWPLWEGPHSPAGKSVAVDEESQADFLTRYYLEVLTTGWVERVYWWRPFAKGYGLIDPADDRRRPSFAALATLARLLAGSSCRGRLDTPHGVRAYGFETAAGRDLVVAWTTSRRRERAELTLPREASEGLDRDGQALSLSSSTEVEVTSSPRYFTLVAG